GEGEQHPIANVATGRGGEDGRREPEDLVRRGLIAQAHIQGEATKGPPRGDVPQSEQRGGEGEAVAGPASGLGRPREAGGRFPAPGCVGTREAGEVDRRGAEVARLEGG